jgi:hypothetical protein
MDESTFVAFSELLRELSEEHTGAREWSDRADLPMAVRAFWRQVGSSPLSAPLAPRESASTDLALFEAVFDDWFDSALLRDRWAIGPGDESAPLHVLPPAARLLFARGDDLLVASEVEPEPRLWTLSSRAPKLTAVASSYFTWCMHTLLYRGTRLNVAACSAPVPDASSSLLPIPIARVGEGVYRLLPIPPATSSKNAGSALFRNVACYVRFVLSLTPEARMYWAAPSGASVVYRSTKKFPLTPVAPEGYPGFERLALPGSHGGPSLLGRLGERWVWVTGGGPPDQQVVARCDASDLESVGATLASLGAKVLKTNVYRPPLSNPEW